MRCIAEPCIRDEKPVLVLGAVRVDLGTGAITHAGGAVDRLRPAEHALLQRLYSEHGGVVSRERLLVDVWGYAASSASRTLEATVARLRALLRDADSRCVVTVHGVGYALVRLPSEPALALVDRDELLDLAAGWIASHPGGWLTLTGGPGVGKSCVLQALARRSYRGDVRVYTDGEAEGRAALEDVLRREAGPRLVFADLGSTDPTWLGERPRWPCAHTLVLAARTPLDNRFEAILDVPALSDLDPRP